MMIQGQQHEPAAETSSVRRWLLLRAHAWVIAVLGAGLVVRIVVMIAYREAFFYPDSRNYTTWALRSYPAPLQPYGYSLFLRPFVPGPMAAVAVVQHLMGLGLALLGYVYLAKRAVPRWLAALAVVPVALDGRQITLEHYVMAETLFLAVVAVALIVLTLRPKSWMMASLAGVLLAFAAVTRSVGLPLAVLAVGYLLIRRAGWRPLTGLVLSVAIPLVGYLLWYHERHGVYAFGQYTGRYLYARVQTFADCDRLNLTAEQRVLCVDTPVSAREQRTDLYLWNDEFSPAHRLYRDLKYDPFLRDFAVAAITQQPVDFTAMVLRESGWHFLPSPPLDSRNECLASRWVLPDLPGEPCQAILYTPTASTLDTPVSEQASHDPLRAGLARYSRVVATPGPLLAVCVLLALAAMLAGRRADRRAAIDALLLSGSGVGMIVLSVATSMFETRYALPAVWLLPVGAALAAKALFFSRTAVPLAVSSGPTAPGAISTGAAGEAPPEQSATGDRNMTADGVPAAPGPTAG